jgi:putative NADH-flavin reductase
MKITVFGANGKVGRLVVEQLLAGGHEVTAFVHRSHAFAAHPSLAIAQGDIYNTGQVAAAVAGSQAVISALGSWGTPKKDVLASATRNIIPAMQAAGITRIVSLTGADARAAGDTLSPIHRITHLMISALAGKVLHDGEDHIRLLAASSLDWTVLRSPPMTGSTTHTYNLVQKRPMPWATVPRNAVATAMVDQLTKTDFLRQSPYIVK